MLWFHTTRMARVMISVVINMTNVTATPACKKKKNNLNTSSSQLRADQAPNPPWGNWLATQDHVDVTNLEPMNVKHPATGDP